MNSKHKVYITYLFFWRAEVATNSWKSNSSLDHDHQDHPYHDHQHHTHHDYQHHPHHRHLGPLGKPARYCGPALSYSCSGSRLSQHIFTIVLAVLIIIIILIFYTLAPPTIHLNTYSEPFPLKIVLNMTFVDPRKKITDPKTTMMMNWWWCSLIQDLTTTKNIHRSKNHGASVAEGKARCQSVHGVLWSDVCFHNDDHHIATMATMMMTTWYMPLAIDRRTTDPRVR